MADYIIVGAGPGGLTLAYYLGKLGYKILLLEKESVPGGCHRVRRVDGYFSEHGPRIYINNYFSLINMLQEWGIKFEDLFLEYNFGMNIPATQIMNSMTLREKIIIAIEFFIYMIYPEGAKQQSVLEFFKLHNFSDQTIKIFDRICRLTDGGRIENYTLFELFEVFNQNIFYQTYQPKLPNDKGLLKIWINKILETGNVKILYNVTVDRISNDAIVTANGQIYHAKKYIFTIPPKPFISILEKSNNPSMFGEFNQLQYWANKSAYFDYLPVTYHWKERIDLPHVWGSTDSDWGIIFIVLSDYMYFEESQTVIIVASTLNDSKSQVIGKTANQSTEKELVTETFRQLSEILSISRQPDVSILSESLRKENDKWVTSDTAFIYTKLGYAPTYQHDNIYWIGSHTGFSNYNFTSLETAIQNALTLGNILDSRIQKPNNMLFTAQKTIVIVVIIIIFMIMIYRYYGTSGSFIRSSVSQ